MLTGRCLPQECEPAAALREWLTSEMGRLQQAADLFQHVQDLGAEREAQIAG